MKWISLNLLAALVALGTAGCEVGKCDDPGEQPEDTEEVTDEEDCTSFKSLKRFTGNTDVQNLAYASGKKVVIENTNGPIDVIQGTVSDQVSVTVLPFVMRAHDATDAEAQQSMERLVVDVRLDGDENPIVSITREEDSNMYLGAEVTVELPDGFDGELDVHTWNGTTDIDYVGAATSLIVESENGDIEAVGGDADSVSITGDLGDIAFSAGTIGDLWIESTGLGDIAVEASSVSSIHIADSDGDISAGFGEILPGGSDNIIGTHDGAISLSLPASSAFSVQAVTEEGSVSFGTLPAACSEQVAAENSKTLTCGTDGPTIDVDARGMSSSVTATVQ